MLLFKYSKDYIIIISTLEQVRFQSTVAPKCVFPRFHRPQKCCVDIEFDLRSSEGSDHCSKQGLTLNLPTCQMQLCQDNWNRTLVIPLASSGKNDDHSNEIIYTLTPIGMPSIYTGTCDIKYSKTSNTEYFCCRPNSSKEFLIRGHPYTTWSEEGEGGS